jgi:hypothetical protein
LAGERARERKGLQERERLLGSERENDLGGARERLVARERMERERAERKWPARRKGKLVHISKNHTFTKLLGKAV